MTTKNILLWCGAQGNQRALANKLYDKGLLSGIVIEKPTQNTVKSLSGSTILQKVIDRMLFAPIHCAWFNMLQFYDNKYTRWPDVPILEVDNINSEAAYAFSKDYNPHLVLVSGTRLIRDKMLALSTSIGIINLHTGLSPYIKGGPNCTNWCIVNKTPHYIGNTIMWIDAGIDSGNIIATEIVRFTGFETFNEIHIGVMEQAHSLYLRTVEYLLADEPINKNNIVQSDIAEGSLFLTKMWNFKKKLTLLRRIILLSYKKDFLSDQYHINIENTKVISIE